jgi:hypothetical protein
VSAAKSPYASVAYNFQSSLSQILCVSHHQHIPFNPVLTTTYCTYYHIQLPLVDGAILCFTAQHCSRSLFDSSTHIFSSILYNPISSSRFSLSHQRYGVQACIPRIGRLPGKINHIPITISRSRDTSFNSALGSTFL